MAVTSNLAKQCMSMELIGSKSEPMTIILLNGHSNKMSSKLFSLYLRLVRSQN